MRKNSVLLLLVIVLSLLLVWGCEKRGEEQETAKEAETTEKAEASGEEERQAPPAHSGNILVEELSNPDEALLVLTESIDKDLWGKYLKKDDAVPSGSDAGIGFSLGVKSANSLLAVFLKDYDTAEKLAKNLQAGAEKLNVQSAEIEATAKQLGEDLKETDEAAKDQLVKGRLNKLREQVIYTLKEIGNKEVSLMMELGVWAEGMRQVSGLVKDDYSEDVSQVLFRRQEVEYFMKSFGLLKAQDNTGKYDDLLDALSSVQKVLESADEKVLPKSDVETIHAIMTGIVESGI